MRGDDAGIFLDPAAPRLLAGAPAPRRALFLDRDGVINVDRAYVHRPRDTEWIPGIFDLCRAARDAGCLLIVVTNQAGIARGLYDEAQFLDYTRWMHAEFERRGVPLLATYHCPHHPTAGLGSLRRQCDCRKPAPGMLLRALREHALDASASMLVGDKPGDVQAGSAAGLGLNLLYAPARDIFPNVEHARQVDTMVQAQQLLEIHVSTPSTGGSHVSP